MAAKSKIHTIRQNLDHWQKQIDQVIRGHAHLNVKIWTGLPYRSKKELVVTFTHMDCICVQKIIFKTRGIYIDGIGPFPIESIAANDGLSIQDFQDWFSKKLDSNEPMALIHFTGFRYTEERLEQHRRELQL